MGYKIRLYKESYSTSEGSIEIIDKTINNSYTSIPIVGIGATDYAKNLSESIVWVSENFAGPSEPTNPLQGQLWYDTNIDKIKVNISENGSLPIWESIHGVAGVNGTNGVDGINGVDGEPGAQGEPGAPGDIGTQGRPGDNGVDGVDGVDGDTGPAGPPGPTGIPGISSYQIHIAANTTPSGGNPGDIWVMY